ncbi:cyclic nucleotide-binding/CBS domain-containing protein [Methanococcoides sp. NM1]|uniref:CBS domain-containing protein n=1 Tax=Methanococcoides sp. NM1 TaxID=1201013 RepID=UPI0010824BED|nr:CBS domain-containing protein [Methanococcoides sp. NM1]
MVMDTTNDQGTNESIKEIEKYISVKEVMTEKVITTDIEESALKVGKEMIKHNVGSIIVTKNDEAVGIITEREMIKKIIAKNKKPENVSASMLMSSPLIMIKPSTNVIDASKTMSKANIRRLAVMQNGKIAGIITDRDLLTIAPGLNTILADLIEMNREQNVIAEEEYEGGICQRCGYYVADLAMVNGRILCESCRDEEEYYD